MTVPSAANKVSYAGDGSTTAFSVPFLFLANADITAILRDANDVETTWVEGTDYTLTGAGDPSGGTLTATTAPASGETLVIKRVVPLTQGTDYPEGGKFPAQAHEDALDRGTMADQQLQEQIDRAITVKATSAQTGLTVPDPSALKHLRWNSAADALENADAVQWLTGSGAPAASLGIDGDMYLDTATDEVYGPKSAGVWGTPVADLTGTTGATGPAGADGVFAGTEPTVAGATGDKVAILDTSDAENPKYVLIGTADAELPLGAQTRLSRLPQAIKTATPYTVVAADVGTMLIANLGSAITFDLTAAATLGAGFVAFIKNIGAGTLTIDPAGAETIDGSATMTLAQNEWTLIWTEGTSWRSLGAMGVTAAGVVKQIVSIETGVVATGTTTIPSDDTIPQNTEGDEYMTLSITPASASNRLIIEVTIWLANSEPGSTPIHAALFQDSVADALAAVSDTKAGTNEATMIAFTHIMAAGTVSATTFRVRGGSDIAGTMTFNGSAGTRRFGGIAASSIVITEIEP